MSRSATDVVDLTNRGIPHFSEAGLGDALTRVTSSGKLVAAQQFDENATCDTYIITVGTPLSSEGTIRLDMIEAATHQVAENMNDGALVILRSTVKVETTRKVVAPILAATGKQFDIAMCPERTLEGRALQELRELPQIIGAEDAAASDRAAAVFQRLPVQSSRCQSGGGRDRQARRQHLPRCAVCVRQRSCQALRCVRSKRARSDLIRQARLLTDERRATRPGRWPVPREGSAHPAAECSDSWAQPGDHVSGASGQRTPTHRDGQLHHQRDSPAQLGSPLRVRVIGMAFKGIPATDDLRGSMSDQGVGCAQASSPRCRVRGLRSRSPPDVLAKSFPGEEVFTRFGDAVSGASIVVIANNHPALGAIFRHAP